MDLVLQAQGQSCPIAPGMELATAISLLEMSVFGIPLLLALFQFINNHRYPKPADTISARTVLYTVLMVLSAFVLLGLYWAAYRVIGAELGRTVVTALLFVLWWAFVGIIVEIISLQLEQMLIERLRAALVGYLGAIGLGVVAVVNLFQTGLLVRVVAGVLAVGVAIMGLASQRSVRSDSQDNQEAGAEDADEGMESLDSVYK